MAIEFLESFDDGLYNLGKWSTLTPGSGHDLSASGRTGNGLRIRDTANFNGRVSRPGATTIVVGCAYNIRFTSGSAAEVMILMEGSVEHINLNIPAGTTNVQIRRSTTVLATAVGAASVDGFHYWELKVVVHQSAGSVELRRDNVVVASATGIDTFVDSGSTGEIDTVRFAGNTAGATVTNRTIIDDIYIDSDTFIGSPEIRALFPAADGDVNDWTPDTGADNFARVDENPPDDDTSYVETSAAGDVDVYTMDSITDSGIVHGLISRSYVRNAGVGSVNVRQVARRSAANEVGSDVAIATAYGIASEIFTVDPHTSAQWTRANLNNTQFGIESRA